MGKHEHGDNGFDYDAIAMEHGGVSRRNFLKSSAAGVAAGALGGSALGNLAQAAGGENTANVPDGTGRTLIHGGVVLSLDPAVGDFEEADVLIEGKKIVAVAPNLKKQNPDAFKIDAKGMIVMPGFITTHHHQYETIQRSIISDGLTGGQVFPQEGYTAIVQNMFTAGRIPDPAVPGGWLWDIGRPPYDPEDLYISEVATCVSELSQGITCGSDTSQASHTPAHTDAMIQGLLDSGRRSLFDYSAGTNRSAQFPDQPFEHPGIMGDETVGVGRLRKEWFPTDDMLVTLGLNAGPGPAFPGAAYSGWQLARSFGAWINNHSGTPAVLLAPATQAQLMDPNIGPYVTQVHCTRWVTEPFRQVHADSRAPTFQLIHDAGAHVSIAVIIEMAMRIGMPPFQLALNHGILPSLSPDVDTTMTPDPFSLMRGAFTLQRALANELASPITNPDNLPLPQLVTCRQVIEMGTIAGAAGSGLLHKVGTLTPGKEADIVMLDTNNINIAPMNNAPGAVVTFMDTRHVRHVMIAGAIKFWKGKLVGWDVDKLIRDLTTSRDRVLDRINGPYLIGPIPPLNNSPVNPYRPNFLTSCCYNGQNTTAPHYVLTP